tara:strand:+ start:614 stop:2146 length:1533 start_codon:yes stop_codon:yes gene_type:complete
MSFKSLVNKLVKEGKSREAATKIAGKVANAKMKGAGSGPTAKQKARMKGSPAKADWKMVQKSKGAGGRKSKEVYKDGKLVKSKSKAGKAYTNSGEYKTVTKEKFKGGTKSKDVRKVKGGVYTEKHKSTDVKSTNKSKGTKGKIGYGKTKRKETIKEINTTSKRNKGTTTYVKQKSKSKSDGVGTRKTKVGHYVGQGTGKKATISKQKSTPAKMKKQGYNARLDDSLGAKHGKKSQSLKSRRDESEGMEKSMKRRKFSGNKSSGQGRAQTPDSKKRFKKDPKKNVTRVKTPMDIDIDVSQGKGKRKGSPAKQIDPPKKQKAKGTLVKSTKRQKISGTKTASPKKGNYLTKEMRDSRTGKVTSRSTKPASTKKITYEQYEGLPHKDAANARAARKMGYMMNYNTGQYEPTPNKRGAERRKESGLNRFQAYDQMDTRNAAQTAGSPMGMYGKHSPANAYGSPMKMSGQSYDAKQAYNKNLSASARLHYLENNRADAKAKKGGHAIHKHMGGRR